MMWTSIVLFEDGMVDYRCGHLRDANAVDVISKPCSLGHLSHCLDLKPTTAMETQKHTLIWGS